MPREKYFIQEGAEESREVDAETWMAEEMRAGFFPKEPGRPATGGFSYDGPRGEIRGSIQYVTHGAAEVALAPASAPNAVDALLEWCEVKVRMIDKSMGDIGISDGCKMDIVSKVLQKLKENPGLELSREHPSIFLIVESHTPPKKAQGILCIEFICNVMIFTNQEPKSFRYTLLIPAANAGISIDGGNGVN